MAHGRHVTGNVVPSVKTITERFVFKTPTEETFTFQLPAVAAKGK